MISSKHFPNAEDMLESRGGIRVLQCATWSQVVPHLDTCNALIVPGGSATQQWNEMSKEHMAAVREFVRRGGGYIGFCAGAFLGGASFLKLVEVEHVAKLVKAGDLKGQVRCAEAAADAGAVVAEVSMNYHNGPVYDWKLPRGVCVVATAVDVSNDLSKVRSKMRNKPMIVESTFGAGHVVLCGPHPEHTDGLQEWTWRLISRCIRHPRQ